MKHMKGLLYRSTALVAASLFAGNAMAADKIQVGVGGYFQAFAVFIDQDDGVGEPGANRRDHTLQREAEIIFNGKTTLDNGLEVGVQVQLEAESCGDQIDESFIWFEGGWGRVNIGSENSAAYLMAYAAPSPSAGLGVQSPNFSVVAAGTNSTNVLPGVAALGAYPHTNPVDLSGDSEKLTYFTPRIAGFQLGASYTPDNCEEANAGSIPPLGTVSCGGSYIGAELDNNNSGEVIEIGVNFVQKFGAFSVAASGSWGQADTEVAGNTDDTEQWSLGANLGWGGFTVGAGYMEVENYAINNVAPVRGVDTRDWNIGLRYQTGPWGVGVAYASREVDDADLSNEDELDMIEVGGTYDLGPGVQLTGGVQLVEIDGDDGPADSNDATVIFVGTSLTF